MKYFEQNSESIFGNSSRNANASECEQAHKYIHRKVNWSLSRLRKQQSGQ